MRRSFIILALLAPLALASCASSSLEPVDNSDAAVMARVKQTFRMHPEFNVQYLDLNVDAGAVTISGIIDSIEAREALRKLVGRVPGVQQVIVNVLLRE